jgi:hypothetical protein
MYMKRICNDTASRGGGVKVHVTQIERSNSKQGNFIITLLNINKL